MIEEGSSDGDSLVKFKKPCVSTPLELSLYDNSHRSMKDSAMLVSLSILLLLNFVMIVAANYASVTFSNQRGSVSG